MTECSAVLEGSDHCRNGFPQRMPCFTGEGTPVCMNENLCGRLYAHCGGKPPKHLLSIPEQVQR